MKAFLAALAAVLAIVMAGVIFFVYVIDFGDDVDYYESAYIQDEIELYLAESSPDLPGDESYGFVQRLAPVDDWLLITVARTKTDADENTGTSGLLVIGKLQDKGWEFRLQGEKVFDTWLSLLPERLLPTQLRDYFRSYPQNQTASVVPPGALVSTNSILEEQFYLPYPEGTSFKISTLPGDSHHKGSIENALDFDMPEGTKLLSIANGTVMGFKDDSTIGGCDKKYAYDANYIRIKVTPDLAVLYLHTQADSVPQSLKAKGAKVVAGKTIAKSGWSGFTCNWTGTGPGAHLHIVLEKLCDDKGCGSVPLNFVEFGPKDPRHEVAYVSQNQSPEKRKQIEEEKKQAQLAAEAEEIKAAVKSFLSVYTCSTLKDCDEADLITTSVTDGLMSELFPSVSFCFSRCPIKWDSSALISLKFVPFTYTGESCFTETNEVCFTVTTRGVSISETSSGRVSRYGEITHYTVVDYFLVRKNGVWKVDGYKIVCGYTADQNGKMIPEEETVEEENLDGCFWQPPEENEEPASESTP